MPVKKKRNHSKKEPHAHVVHPVSATHFQFPCRPSTEGKLYFVAFHQIRRGKAKEEVVVIQKPHMLFLHFQHHLLLLLRQKNTLQRLLLSLLRDSNIFLL